MSGFSADWLALRAPADDRARSVRLIERLGASLGPPPLSLADLGAGSGATMVALSDTLKTPLRWQLIDQDEALLARALDRASALEGVEAQSVPCDLSTTPRPWTVKPHALTASALFDLTSQTFVAELARACATERLPLLSMLTFDGILSAEPIDPDDGEMRAAFNRHQRGEKSFGTALGPGAPKALADAFAAHGYSAEEDATPWLLRAGRDDALMSATIKGWADAAREVAERDGADAGRVDAWEERRLQRTDRLIVGHRDQLFLPG